MGVRKPKVVEICAGAGGQALGLERAGFDHQLAVELDPTACRTLRHNRPHWDVAEGDVADPEVWKPADHTGVDLLAGGVPCPPFTIAGQQLGATDERDLFAWAVTVCDVVQPRALLLENVRGLSGSRFSGYRQAILDKLRDSGYIGEWRLLHASDYGVPQLRPRFVLVAMKPEYAEYYSWPEPTTPGDKAIKVGPTLLDLMESNGWEGAKSWAEGANEIAPTIVGGSKKHGGADLGPSRAKAAWAKLGVDAWAIAETAPGPDWEPAVNKAGETRPGPKLTAEMVARLQGWLNADEWRWEFQGLKTSQYRQIGNAFPPPLAKAVGIQILRALNKKGQRTPLVESSDAVHDPVYRLLRSAERPIGAEQIVTKLDKIGVRMDLPGVERHINHLVRDFDVQVVERKSGGPAYQLGEFKAFIGQQDHERHDRFSKSRSRIS